LLDGDHTVAVRVLDRLVELRLRVGDPTVLRERRLRERVGDAGQLRRAVDGLGALLRGERSGAKLRHRVLDRGLPLRCVEPLALWGREDDVEDAALLGGELRLDQGGRPLRVRPRDLELVAEAAAHGGDERYQDDDDPEPRPEDAPRMGRARARPAGERSGRHAFVRGEPRASVSVRRIAVLTHEVAPSLMLRIALVGFTRIHTRARVHSTAVMRDDGTGCRTIHIGKDPPRVPISSVSAGLVCWRRGRRSSENYLPTPLR